MRFPAGSGSPQVPSPSAIVTVPVQGQGLGGPQGENLGKDPGVKFPISEQTACFLLSLNGSFPRLWCTRNAVRIGMGGSQGRAGALPHEPRALSCCLRSLLLGSLVICGKNFPRLIDCSPLSIRIILSFLFVSVSTWKKELVPDPGRDGEGACQSNRVPRGR